MESDGGESGDRDRGRALALSPRVADGREEGRRGGRGRGMAHSKRPHPSVQLSGRYACVKGGVCECIGCSALLSFGFPIWLSFPTLGFPKVEIMASSAVRPMEWHADGRWRGGRSAVEKGRAEKQWGRRRRRRRRGRGRAGQGQTIQWRTHSLECNGAMHL